jgi:hypothetical protein
MNDQPDKPDSQPQHRCDRSVLTFVGHYGAPGAGQAWRCPTCGMAWARICDTFVPASEGAHLLTLDDVI